MGCVGPIGVRKLFLLFGGCGCVLVVHPTTKRCFDVDKCSGFYYFVERCLCSAWIDCEYCYYIDHGLK